MKAVKRALIAAASVGALLTALGAGPAVAAPINFTWTPSAVGFSGGAIVNANNISPLNDFATIQVDLSGNFNESGALNVTGFLNGASTVASTGLGAAGGYSLYYVFVGAGNQGGPVPTTLGGTTTGSYSSLSYELIASTTPLPAFNPANTNYYSTLAALNAAIGSSGDIVLATGSLVGTIGNTVTLSDTSTGLSPNANVEVTLIPCVASGGACTGNESAFFTSPSANIGVLQFGDFSATGTVTTEAACGDFSCVYINGGGGNITEALAPVPEPVTLSLFGAGLAGLGAMRLRKKKRA